MPVSPAGRVPFYLKPWAWSLLIFGLVLLCYWPALNGALLWDDPAHVPRPDLRTWQGLGRIWFSIGATQQYYPVLFSAFWLEHQLWGDHTLGYHLVNVFLHAGSACLLAVLLGRLWHRWTPRPAVAATATSSEMPCGTEWVVALLFALHPLGVESVAWITEQKNTLSLFFYLLSALAFFEWYVRRGTGRYMLATVLFALALGSKTTAATLPAALLVVLWWRQGTWQWRRDVLPLAPWLVFAFASGLTTSWLERKLIGAEGADFDLVFGHRFFLAARIAWFYASQLVWPANLMFFYPRWDVATSAAGWTPYVLALLAVVAALWAVRRRARGPLAGWLLFLGTLFPALGFFNVYPFVFSYVADHFQYLANPPLIATIVGAVAWAVMRGSRWLRVAAVACAGLVAVVFAGMTYRQSALYTDNVTLFRATVEKNPASWMGHHVLAFALAKLPGTSAEAMLHYEEALRLNPRYPDAHLGLGVELARLGRKAEAIARYTTAIELRPEYAEAHNALAFELADLPGRAADAVQHGEVAVRVRPHLAEAHHNLAYALARVPGRRAEAEAEYLEALRLRPNYASAHFNLGNLLAGDRNRMDAAISHYRRALELEPDSPAAHFNFANTLVRQPSGLDEAVQHYETALRLKPDFADAHVNLGNALSLRPGREAQAVSHYEAALRLDPNQPTVHYNLALHLASAPGRMAEAIAHAEAALQLKPDFLEAHNSVAILYAQQGRLAEARAHWEKALEINPQFEPARQNLQLLQRMAPR